MSNVPLWVIIPFAIPVLTIGIFFSYVMFMINLFCVMVLLHAAGFQDLAKAIDKRFFPNV